MINKTRNTLCIMLLLVCGAFLWPQQASAQIVYGVTAVEYDAAANRLYGYSATETDYYASLYYDSYVEGYIYNQNGSTLDSGSDLNYPLAEVYTSAGTSPGQTYYVISDHYVGAYSYYYDYYYGGYYFYDPLGYSFLGGGSYGSPYGFAPGGGPTYATYQLYYLGSTGIEARLPGVPQISNMVPGNAPLGTSVEVNFSGSNFGTNPSINIGGSGVRVSSISYVTDTRITAIFDIDSNASTGNHSVSVSSGGYTSNSVNFQVGNRTPQINGINPSSGAAGDNIPVTISGTGFGSNPSLSVGGGINASVTSVGDQQITANFSIPLTTPPGSYSVRVTSNGFGGSGFISGGGSSPTSNSVNFTVTPAPAPRITAYAPNAAQLGVSVEINVQGENFGTNPTLRVEGRGVTVRSYTPVSNPDRQIVAILDIAADAETGNHAISVVTRGLSSNSVNFQVGDRSPQITQITPPSGVRGTTQQVVLTGSGFGSSPTLQVTGTGVNVTVNSATDTRITATFSIASTAEPLTRTVTLTSRGLSGNGFVASPGTNSNASANYGIQTAKVNINSIDKRFAPSVERLALTYSISPITFTAPNAKLEIFKNGDNANPIFRDESIAKNGANIPYQQGGALGWDGKANMGAEAGKYMGPEGSPYTARISIASNALYTDARMAQKTFAIELDSVETTPDYSSEYKLNKLAVADTEIDTKVSATVKIKNKLGKGVPTAIPFKVNWSFTDPDDTADSALIDTNGNTGDDNAPVGKNGKRGAGSKMWKAEPNFNSVIDAGGQTAVSDTATTGADMGTAKLVFSSSVVAADNYLLVAQINNSAGQPVKEIKFKRWSVRKPLTFSNFFKMKNGVDVRSIASEGNVKEAFNGDGYTDYKTGRNALNQEQTDLTDAQSPEFVAPLLAPNAAETPTAQELADYTAGSQPAKAAIQAKAQAWFRRNFDSLGQAFISYAGTIAAPAYSLIGGRYVHPKLDGRAGDGRAAGSAKFYPDGLLITDDYNNQWDPNLDWGEVEGGEIGEFAFIFINTKPEQRRIVAARHEVGHASDHEPFHAAIVIPSDQDHAASGLMHKTADQSLVNPYGLSTLSEDSILRLRGLKR